MTDFLESVLAAVLVGAAYLLAREYVPRLLHRWRTRGYIKSARDGDWLDPATWEGGKVPGDGARVLLRHHVLAPREGSGAPSIRLGRVLAEGDGGVV